MIAIVIIVVAPLGLEVGLTLAERCVCVCCGGSTSTCGDMLRLTQAHTVADAGYCWYRFGFVGIRRNRALFRLMAVLDKYAKKS